MNKFQPYRRLFMNSFIYIFFNFEVNTYSKDNHKDYYWFLKDLEK